MITLRCPRNRTAPVLTPTTRSPPTPPKTPPPPRFSTLSAARSRASPLLQVLSLDFSLCPSTALSLRFIRPPSPPLHSPPVFHQLLPVPGPDPALAPLWWLGGVRARHRPQTPMASRVGCGRGVHTVVHTLVPPVHPRSDLGALTDSANVPPPGSPVRATRIPRRVP